MNAAAFVHIMKLGTFGSLYLVLRNNADIFEFSRQKSALESKSAILTAIMFVIAVLQVPISNDLQFFPLDGVAIALLSTDI